MGWESRGSQRFYYRKARAGGRVVSTYVPGMGAQVDERELEERQNDRDANRRYRETCSSNDASFRAWFVQVGQLVTRAIEAAGFHRHDRGRWRRRRMSSERPDVPAECPPADGSPLAIRADDLTAIAERCWLACTFRGVTELRAAFEARMSAMRVELAGPSPNPLETLLVERVVMCWLQLSILEACAGTDEGFQGDAFGKRVERAHRMYLGSIKALTDFRRLPIPAAAIQVNIANVINGSAAG